MFTYDILASRKNHGYILFIANVARKGLTIILNGVLISVRKLKLI